MVPVSFTTDERNLNMATTNRAVRVSDDVWQTAVAKAAEEGTTVTAIVCKALEAFNRKPAPKRRAKAASKR